MVLRAIVVSVGHRLLPQSLLHVRSKRQLGVGWHVAGLLDLVDFLGDNGVDHFFGACREVVACLRCKSGTNLCIRLLLIPDGCLDVLGQLFWARVAHACSLGLAHDHLLVSLSCLGKHWLTAKNCQRKLLARLSVKTIMCVLVVRRLT